jgi:hypothetical protein
MERDPMRRYKLGSSWEINREAVAEGIIDADGLTGLPAARRTYRTKI